MNINLDAMHDKEITKISYNRTSSSLKIEVNDEFGNVTHVELAGCSIFRVNDFIHQNVISRVIEFGHNISREYIKDKIIWATEVGGASSYFNTEKMDDTVDDILFGNLKLVYFEPSFGAEIVATCKDIIFHN
ncbi:hypothetical protein [Phyllobacterium endophyticum]|uniref:hypothetical protein n=1 Tax=Phyllobacterium endophyticum TaxID=1149773 RepID=UPI0011C868A2|nr:hypothetical protein [Phyllobacterium endophyticum]TXR49860.1 hypothetical protein FVA77_07540 [Phyllobacterium endophyticum]